MHQVVYTDVLIVGRLDVDGQSFAPIGLHQTDAASDWLLIKRTSLRWYERLAGSPVTKLIGLIGSRKTVPLSYVYLMTGELAPVVQRHEEPVPDQVGVHAPHTLLQGLVQL